MSADHQHGQAAKPGAGSGEAGAYGRVAVIGAGAWGTALACIAARAGRDVTLWTRRENHAEELAGERRNRRYLPQVELPEALRPTANLGDALEGAEAALLVVPSQAVRETARRMRGRLAAGAPAIVCAKGIEAETGLLLTEAAAQELPDAVLGALSGPNFADEAAMGQPTACTVASDEGALFAEAPERTAAARLARTLGAETFRPYVSDDVAGVQVGGAVKNVIAIACGIAAGAGYGANTRAMLITRGLSEMQRLAEALGGRRETLSGLSGVGDLTLTCTSEHSRNMSLGLQLGRGVPRERCFDGRQVVVEGERNALSVTDLARRRGLELPICEAVRGVLHEGRGLREAFALLRARPLRGEPPGLDREFGLPARDGADRSADG